MSLTRTRNLLSIIIAISIIFSSLLISPVTFLPKAYSQNDTNYYNDSTSDLDNENMADLSSNLDAEQH